MTTTPTRLIERCQARDPAAFEELYDQHVQSVYRLALTILQDESAAEDAVQDVFVRVWQNIGRFRGDSAFNTWLTSIVVNTCRDRLRRRAVRRALSLEWLTGVNSRHNVPGQVAARLQRETLWRHVHRLSDTYRLPLILRYYEGLSCAEIAAVLDLKIGTVYARLNTGRRQLRDLLDEEQEAHDA